MILGSVILFLHCSYSYAESFNLTNIPRRIVGGDPADIKDFPYQLALEFYWGFFFCGASIIHRSWAITAAHCVAGHTADSLRLRSGSSYKLTGGTLHEIEKIIIHPKFSRTILDYDVSVIKVSTPFQFSDVTQRTTMADRTPSAGTPAVVSGWGFLEVGGPSSHQLQKATVYIVNHKICKQKYYGIYTVTSRMLCAGLPEGGKDHCHGDSGGPLVVNNELVGIVSWAVSCADKRYPGVYTDVAKVREWVAFSIRKDSKQH